MSRAYITELVGETPLVVVVADIPLVVEGLVSRLEQAHLQVKVVTSQQVIKSDNQDLLATAYRIIWLCPLWKISDIAIAGKQTTLLSTLKPLSSRVVVVVTRDVMVTGTAGRAVSQWQQLVQAQDKFIAWVKAYLAVPILQYQDVFSVPDGQSPSPVMGFILTEQDQNLVLDPHLSFYPQTWTAVMADLATRIAKPQPTNQVIGGKKVSSSTLVKLLVLHLHRLGAPVFQVKTVEVKGTSEDKITTTLYVETADDLANSITLTLKLVATQAAKRTKELNNKPGEGQSSIPRPQVQSPRMVDTANVLVPPEPLQLDTTAAIVKIPPKVPVRVQAQHALSLQQPKQSVTPLKTQVKPKESSSIKPVVSTPLSVAASVAASTMPSTRPSTLPSTANQPPNSLAELDADLSHLFQKYRSVQKLEQVKGIVEVTKTTNRRTLRKRKTFWVGLVMIAVSLGLASLLGLYWLGISSLKHQVIAAINTHNQSTTEGSKTTIPSFNPWLNLVKTQTNLYSLVIPAHFSDAARHTTQFAESWLKLQTNAQDLDRAGSNLFLAMTNRYPVDAEEQVTRTGTLIQQAYEDISLIQASAKQLELSASEDETLGKALTALNTYQRSFAALNQVQPILGSLIGLESRKTYALVLQNDQELRPQGGVIQSVAFITLDKGLIIDTQIMSAAEVDANMIGVAQPPADLKKYLGSEQLAFRDSNWSPDGATAGSEVATLLENATRYNVDGVIFINSLVVKDWLKAVGPLDLPEYNEEITDRNLAAKLEAHSELQVDPTKNREYSTVLLTALLQKTMNTPETKVKQLLQAWGDSLTSKQMSIYLRQADDQEALATLGWTGQIITPACPGQIAQENCLVDVLTQVEANVGVNKANAYVSRLVQHEVTINETQISHTHSLTLTNKATSNSWPRGSYKSYIRFYLPLNAVSPTLLVNGAAVPAAGVDTATENGRQVVGTYVEVPIQEQTNLQLTYTLPAPAAENFSYAFFTQFQPGITPPTYQVKINAPAHRASLIAPQAAVSGSTISFSPAAGLNSLVGVKFE